LSILLKHSFYPSKHQATKSLYVRFFHKSVRNSVTLQRLWRATPPPPLAAFIKYAKIMTSFIFKEENVKILWPLSVLLFCSHSYAGDLLDQIGTDTTQYTKAEREKISKQKEKLEAFHSARKEEKEDHETFINNMKELNKNLAKKKDEVSQEINQKNCSAIQGENSQVGCVQDLNVQAKRYLEQATQFCDQLKESIYPNSTFYNRLMERKGPYATLNSHCSTLEKTKKDYLGRWGREANITTSNASKALIAIKDVLKNSTNQANRSYENYTKYTESVFTNEQELVTNNEKELKELEKSLTEFDKVKIDSLKNEFINQVKNRLTYQALQNMSAAIAFKDLQGYAKDLEMNIDQVKEVMLSESDLIERFNHSPMGLYVNHQIAQAMGQICALKTQCDARAGMTGNPNIPREMFKTLNDLKKADSRKVLGQ
jgi:hypothetical protein